MDACSLRELDYRQGDGIEVALLWQADDNSVSIAVVDHHLREQFAERVDPAAARDAFEHPYAYRSRATQASSRRSWASGDGGAAGVPVRRSNRFLGGRS